MCIRNVGSYLKNLFFFKALSVVIYGSVIWERKTKQDYTHLPWPVPTSPFLIGSCLPLQSYSSSLFSWHVIFQPYWMFSVFPNSPPYQLLAGRRFPLLTLPGSLQILFHVLLRHCCLPGARSEWVSAQLCVPTCTNTSLLVTACLLACVAPGRHCWLAA